MGMIVVIMMVPVAGMAMIGHCAIGMKHAPVGKMGVVVMMVVERNGAACAWPEQVPVFGTLADNFRRSAATYMTVEADHRIGVRHDDMQVM